MAKLDRLEPFDPESGDLTVVVETPKGCRNKYKYDEKAGLFRLHKVLPPGSLFPFDFGFVPSTRGGDGDPLDVLVLMDEPAFTGCVVPCRLIGVIEAEQTEQGGEAVENDRLVAVPSRSHEHSKVQSLDDLAGGLVGDIEHFFASYNEAEGKEFRVTGRGGPAKAEKLVRRGAEALAGDGKADKGKKKHAKR